MELYNVRCTCILVFEVMVHHMNVTLVFKKLLNEKLCFALYHFLANVTPDAILVNPVVLWEYPYRCQVDAEGNTSAPEVVSCLRV